MKQVTAGFSRALFVLVLCLSGGSWAHGEEVAPRSRAAVLSIAPTAAEPGVNGVLIGSGFKEGMRVWLGPRETSTTVVHSGELVFQVPDLAPGTYGLFLKRGVEVVSRVYSFSVVAKTPVLEALTPDRIHGCAGGGSPEVSLSGSNFLVQTQVLLDGAVIASRFHSPGLLTVALPPLGGGLHSIQLKNPGNALSSPLALFVDTRPHVAGIGQGEQFVNYYHLVIDGSNFFRTSQVVVDGRLLSAAAANPHDREKLLYESCTRLIYQRYPYDSTPKTFSVQVINPNGEQSEVVQVHAP